MSFSENRNPLGQLPVDASLARNNVRAICTDKSVAVTSQQTKPISNVPTTSIDDLATSMAKKLIITDEDDDFDEVKGKFQVVDWKKENKEMDKMFESQSAQQLEDLPEFVRPKGFKKSVKFYDHQKDGIRWLVQQERNAPPNPFVRQRQLKDGSIALYDRLTRVRILQPHAPVKGSILADDMGLGKTVQTIGLILSNPPNNYSYDGKTDGADLDAPITTLIVCPKSVISNWITQIDDFVKPGKLNVVTYSGTRKQRSKIVDAVIENEIDILLATYDTIASEFGKDIEGLDSIHDCEFFRIILDEAQQIRNPKTSFFKSINNLAETTEFRLALTGTPFVNKPGDIHSLLAFIGLAPLSDENTFKSYISDPIKERKRAGLTRLRAALAYVALRRTKNIVQGLTMVNKTIQVCSVDFPEGKHKEIHDVLYMAAKAAFQASINGRGAEVSESGSGVSANAQQAMFSLLLRVRQACASGCLVSTGHYEAASTVIGSIKDEDGNIKTMTASDGNRMIDHLQNAPKSDAADERLDVEGNSPKINALLNTVEQMAPDEKGVIFSQWTSFLDILQVALKKAGHKYTRIDGSMTSEERTQALNDITHDDDTRFILCSLKAAGVGINLTRANVAFMMDPWWNEAVESQAIDRVHRLSQTRDVRVYRFVMAGTLEERMLEVQKAKATLGKGAMAKLSAAEEKIAKMTGLKDLFEIKDSGDDMEDFIDNSNVWY